MPTNFQPLQNILDMDFSQMRVLESEGHIYRATDEAISDFVKNLNTFFSQFQTPPAEEDIKTYADYMQKITIKINQKEYAYFLEKYTHEGVEPEIAKLMAEANKLKSFKYISARMQFWAASKEFGDTVRNPVAHVSAVKSLDKWAAFVTKISPNLFFSVQQDDALKSGPSPEPSNIKNHS